MKKLVIQNGAKGLDPCDVPDFNKDRDVGIDNLLIFGEEVDGNCETCIIRRVSIKELKELLEIDYDQATLSLEGTNLTITNEDGSETTIDLEPILPEIDYDQATLSLEGTNLTITNEDGSETTIDLEPILPEIDYDQARLSLSGTEVTITNEDGSETTIDLEPILFTVCSMTPLDDAVLPGVIFSDSFDGVTSGGKLHGRIDEVEIASCVSGVETKIPVTKVKEGDNITVIYDGDTNSYIVSGENGDICEYPNANSTSTTKLIACNGTTPVKITPPSVREGTNVTVDYDSATNAYTVNSTYTFDPCSLPESNLTITELDNLDFIACNGTTSIKKNFIDASTYSINNYDFKDKVKSGVNTSITYAPTQPIGIGGVIAVHAKDTKNPITDVARAGKVVTIIQKTEVLDANTSGFPIVGISNDSFSFNAISDVVEGDNITVDTLSNGGVRINSTSSFDPCSLPNANSTSTTKLIACNGTTPVKITPPSVREGTNVTVDYDSATNAYTVNATGSSGGVDFATHAEMDAGGTANATKAVSAQKYRDEILISTSSLGQPNHAVTAVGYGAVNNTGEGQTRIGQNAGLDATTGGNPAVWSTFVGADAGLGSRGKTPQFFGLRAGQDSGGDFCTFVGTDTGNTNDGSINTALGYQSGKDFTGDRAVNVGGQAGLGTTGNGTTNLGSLTGRYCTGLDNTFVGHYVGNHTTTGYNTHVGARCISAHQHSRTTSIGHNVQSPTGDRFTAIGAEAGVYGFTTRNGTYDQSTQILTMTVPTGLSLGDFYTIKEVGRPATTLEVIDAGHSRVAELSTPHLSSGSVTVEIRDNIADNNDNVIMIGSESRLKDGQSNYCVIGDEVLQNVYSVADFNAPAFNITSDERLKRKNKLIRTMGNGIELWSFTFLNNGSTKIGWIAQQVEELLINAGYDDDTISLAIPKSRDIDWRATLDAVNEEFGTEFELWTDAKSTLVSMGESLLDDRFSTVEDFNRDVSNRIAEYNESSNNESSNSEREMDDQLKEDLELQRELAKYNSNYYIRYADDIRGIDRQTVLDLLA